MYNLPVIPDIESDGGAFYNGNSYFGIAGLLSKVLIDSMLEFSGEFGVAPDADANITPQLRALQMFRSGFNIAIVAIQVFLCLLAIIFTAYCVYRSAVWRRKLT
jgi:hypothetical protein